MEALLLLLRESVSFLPRLGLTPMDSSPYTTCFLQFSLGELKFPLLLLSSDLGWHSHFLGDLCFQSLLQSLFKVHCKHKPLSTMVPRVNAYCQWWINPAGTWPVLPDLAFYVSGTEKSQDTPPWAWVAIIGECFILLPLVAKEIYPWDPRWKWIFPIG